jgi:hypothetical protein
MKGLKLNGWTAQKPPEPELCDTIRDLAIKQVYAKYYLSGKESTLYEIADKVKQQIRQLIKDGKWNKRWKFPGKRTIDRRVNEACEPTWFSDGVPRLASTKAGFYVPNPVRFKRQHETAEQTEGFKHYSSVNFKILPPETEDDESV